MFGLVFRVRLRLRVTNNIKCIFISFMSYFIHLHSVGGGTVANMAAPRNGGPKPSWPQRRCWAKTPRLRHWGDDAAVPALDKISSRIFVTLRYRDEDPIVEKPGTVIIANYASVTIISNQRKTYTYWKTLTLSIRIQKKVTLLKVCANVYLIEFTNSQQHWPRSNPRPIASRNQSQTQLTRPVLDLQRAH